MKSAAASSLAEAIAEAASARARDELPSSPDAIPDDASAATLAKLRATAEAELQAARARGDVAAMGAMGRLIVSIAEHERKNAPDEEEQKGTWVSNEDIEAAAERARVLLRKRLEDVIARRGGA